MRGREPWPPPPLGGAGDSGDAESPSQAPPRLLFWMLTGGLLFVIATLILSALFSFPS